MNLTLYYSPGACSFAPHVILNEIGEPFELKKFSTAERANYSPEYLKVNPKARIPALVINDFVITENPAILTFLGRCFPNAGVYPSDASEAEARCLEQLAWCSNTVHVAFAQIFRPYRYVPSEESFPPIQESGHTNYQQCLSLMEEALQQQEYAVGNQFTVVDPVWLIFHRWGNRTGYDMKANYPALSAYAERLNHRPSVQKALEVEGITTW